MDRRLVHVQCQARATRETNINGETTFQSRWFPRIPILRLHHYWPVVQLERWNIEQPWSRWARSCWQPATSKFFNSSDFLSRFGRLLLKLWVETINFDVFVIQCRGKLNWVLLYSIAISRGVMKSVRAFFINFWWMNWDSSFFLKIIIIDFQKKQLICVRFTNQV